MTRFKLIPYIINVKEKETNNIVPLNNIDGKGTDFLQILTSFLLDIKQAMVLKHEQKTVLAGQIDGGGRDISGIVKSGEYGVEADFHNVDTGEFIPAARKKEHSEMLPFFFFFHLPKKNKGIVILQTFRIYGIKTVFERALNNYLRSSGLIVEFNRLVSHNLLEQLESSRLIELRLIRYDVPRDTADKVHDGSPEEIIEERVFRAKPNKRVNLTRTIKDALSDKQTTYYEILDERYNEVKALTTDGKSRITLSFSEKYAFREFMPLDDLPRGGGFPTYDYLLRKAKDYLDHLKESLGEN